MTSDPCRQRGFSLLIGLILLAGMSLLAVSLVQRGLLDTRFAWRAMEDTVQFQAHEGVIEARLMERRELLEDNLDGRCGRDVVITDGALLRRFCPDAALPPASPELREQLERRYATSYGAVGNQQLSHFRYFELRVAPPPDGSGEVIHQGIVSLSTGGNDDS